MVSNSFLKYSTYQHQRLNRGFDIALTLAKFTRATYNFFLHPPAFDKVK